MTVHSNAALEKARTARIVAASAPAFELTGVDKLFAPLPDVPYLVQRLDMCPGAPTLIAGYGFSGKTLAAQSMAMSVNTGRSVWGDMLVQRMGKVVHLDYEQGFRLTAERYQRLARAMGVTLADLVGLSVGVLPTLTLDQPGARAALEKACDGAALLIVDSLRACAPSLDENSSEVRSVLDMLTAVSNKTGVVPLVIHHARKPNDNTEGGAKVAIRGSSAIFDACASVLVFSGAKGEPVRVSHEKARTSGICAEDFALRIDDVELGDDPRAGLAIETVAIESREDRRHAAQEAESQRLDVEVYRFVVKNPGCTSMSVDSTDEIKGRATHRRQALERLRLSGQVEEQQKGKARTWWPKTH